MKVNPVPGMMIFDVNSGEFWQIFARQGMRNLRNPQLERGEVCIEDIELDLNSTLYKKNAHVHVQKIPFVATSSRACSRGKMIPPKSPTSCQRSR